MLNKTVLITGSSRGIGLAAAKRLAGTGCNIVLNCSKSEEELNKALRLLGSNKTLAIKCDVSDLKQVKSMFEEIKKTFGNVDILVNNAAVSYVGLFNKMQPQEWERIIDVNIKGVFNCCGEVLESMIHNKSGNIINISSIWGVCGASCEAVYSASKGAVNSFTKALAKELAPSGITVNAISCGVIDTDMNAFLSDSEKKALCDEIPAQRFGKPEEIAELIYFLAAGRCSYLTGQVITVDGGFI